MSLLPTCELCPNIPLERHMPSRGENSASWHPYVYCDVTKYSVNCCCCRDDTQVVSLLGLHVLWMPTLGPARWQARAVDAEARVMVGTERFPRSNNIIISTVTSLGEVHLPLWTLSTAVIVDNVRVVSVLGRHIVLWMPAVGPARRWARSSATVSSATHLWWSYGALRRWHRFKHAFKCARICKNNYYST